MDGRDVDAPVLSPVKDVGGELKTGDAMVGLCIEVVGAVKPGVGTDAVGKVKLPVDVEGIEELKLGIETVGSVGVPAGEEIDADARDVDWRIWLRPRDGLLVELEDSA